MDPPSASRLLGFETYKASTLPVLIPVPACYGPSVLLLHNFAGAGSMA
jgi:hypothetical protein